jgi:hypothetical protein
MAARVGIRQEQAPQKESPSEGAPGLPVWSGCCRGRLKTATSNNVYDNPFVPGASGIRGQFWVGALGAFVAPDQKRRLGIGQEAGHKLSTLLYSRDDGWRDRSR